MSKDLRKRGFNFVGPTICYAHMQATGWSTTIQSIASATLSWLDRSVRSSNTGNAAGFPNLFGF